MHHRPVGPPLSARLSGALSRSALRARGGFRRRAARLALGAVLCAVVTAFVLAVPVVSGVGNSAVDLEASSSAGRTPGSAVIMGLDGGAVSSSTFAGATASSSSAPRTSQRAAAPGTTGAAPAETSSAPASEPPAPSPTVQPAPKPPAAAAPRTSAPAPASSSASTPASTPAALAPESGLDGQVLTLVNAARAAAGCGPLVADPGLAGVARAHSEDMRDRGFFDHVDPDGLDPFDRAAAAGQTNARAENIAHGPSSAVAVMDAWMDSPDHRENILDCELRTLGVGVAEGPGGPWWTQLFGD